jgi:hypothetical protein
MSFYSGFVSKQHEVFYDKLIYKLIELFQETLIVKFDNEIGLADIPFIKKVVKI